LAVAFAFAFAFLVVIPEGDLLHPNHNAVISTEGAHLRRSGETCCSAGD
jgi:hypothetical protein